MKSSSGKGGGGKGILKKRRSRKDKKRTKALARPVPGNTRQSGTSGQTTKARVASVFVKAIRERDRLAIEWIGAAAAERVKVTVQSEDGRTLHIARAAASDGHIEVDDVAGAAAVVTVTGTTMGVLVAAGSARVLANPAAA